RHAPPSKNAPAPTPHRGHGAPPPTAPWPSTSMSSAGARLELGTMAKKQPSDRARGRSTLWGRAVTGFVLGVLCGLAARELSARGAIPFLAAWDCELPVCGLIGAGLGVTRLRRALWIAAGVLCAVILVVGYTPLIDAPARALVRRDSLRRCEAVVVLSSSIFRDGSLISVQEDRVLKGVELVRQGYAKRLVLTRLPRPYLSSLPA